MVIRSAAKLGSVAAGNVSAPGSGMKSLVMSASIAAFPSAGVTPSRLFSSLSPARVEQDAAL
jgi:hypothetical protein